MAFRSGGACYGGEVAVQVALGGGGRGRDDSGCAGCLVLLRHGEEGGKGKEGWQHQAGGNDRERSACERRMKCQK